MRALAWEFPNDRSLRDTDTQFLLGPSILVTPVLEPDAKTVRGVFPGIGEGTRWYDWYTFREVQDVLPHENVTMDAPLEHINLHIRGGSIMPLQKPGNTTSATRKNPYDLVIAPDAQGHASGRLYLDDGESIEPGETRFVEVSILIQDGRKMVDVLCSCRTPTVCFTLGLGVPGMTLLHWPASLYLEWNNHPYLCSCKSDRVEQLQSHPNMATQPLKSLALSTAPGLELGNLM